MEAAEQRLAVPVDETVAGAGRQFPTIPLLEQTQVLFEREGGLTECYVPSYLIDHEEVPVKEEWASSIARQMREVAEEKGGTGQKTPIRLGWIEGEEKFRIIDGFHRDAALILNGVGTIYATVEKTDWDSLYDDRIFTAKDHAHVRFSRVVKWIQEVWEYSGLNDKMSVEQAILLYRYDNMNGSKLGLDPSDVESARRWVARKEKQWDTAAMTIHSYLQTAERVDPVLVNATREKKSGHVLKAPTQQILKVFSEHLPNEFELQNLVWQAAKAHNLQGPQVKAVARLVQGKDIEEATELISATDIPNIDPVYESSKKRSLRRAADPRYKGATALKASRTEIDRIRQRVKMSLERGEEVDDVMAGNLAEALNEVKQLQEKLGALTVELAELKDRQKPASDELATVESRKAVENAYRRHVAATIRNTHIEPRLRNRLIVMDLPEFGKFTGEDWESLEPHVKFALALDHPELRSGRFGDRGAYWKAAIVFARLADPKDLPATGAGLVSTIKPLIAMLTTSAPRQVGEIIKLDPKTHKAALTKDGRAYLSNVVKNALIEVDESRE